MFKINILTALRSFTKNLSHSIINIFGLTIGLSCALLIFLWVNHELSYDKYHEDYQDIYRVVEHQSYAGNDIFPVAVTPPALAPALVESFPEIENACRVVLWTMNFKVYGEKVQDRFAISEPEFFEIFNVNAIEGNPVEVIKNTSLILVSERAALKYFGTKNAMGKEIEMYGHKMSVGGIFENLPENTHFDFDVVVSNKIMESFGYSFETWGSNSLFTYIKTTAGADQADLESKIRDFVKEHNPASSVSLLLQPLSKIHLFSGATFAADVPGHGDILYVRIFLLIGIFIVLIACINFINLTTAKSAGRSLEVGVRKVMGATRASLSRQFIMESILAVFISTNFALIISRIFLNAFNHISGKDLVIPYSDPWFIMILIGSVIFIGVLSGVYPSFVMSSYKAVSAMKGEKTKGRSGAGFRRVLVSFQFILSVLLMVGTITVTKQLDFINKLDVGYDRNDVITFSWGNRTNISEFDQLKKELEKNAIIQSVSLTSELPLNLMNSSSQWGWEGMDTSETVLMHNMMAYYDFEKVFNIDFVAGRSFSKEFATDSAACILNETALALTGYDDPIGKPILSRGGNLEIIGIVEDFHFKPVTSEIEPMIILLEGSLDYANIVVKYKEGSTKQALELVSEKMLEFTGDKPVMHFVDDYYQTLYKTESRIKTIVTYFALFAIFISCLGLLGLSAFMAETKTREIGVRKALGSTVAGILKVFSKEYLMLLLIANLIALPLAYFLMKAWLQNFFYQTELSWWIFLLAFISSVFIAQVTVLYYGLRAARLNPSDALRYE